MSNKFVAVPDNGRLSFEDKVQMEYVNSICAAIRSIGVGDASTNMGGLELLSSEIKDGSIRIAAALEQVAEAIRDHE